MGASKLPLAIGFAIVLAVVAFLAFGPKAAPPPPPVLTADAKSYLANLPLTDVNMSAADSMTEVSLLEITGRIGNRGDRAVQQVLVTCYFHEPNGQVIQKERVAVIGPRTGVLAPGASKPFRLNFDAVPPNWNQVLPDLVIAEIRFR